MHAPQALRGALRAAHCVACATLLTMTMPAPARAHHGRDFLLAQTADLPHAGQFFLVARQDRIDDGEEEEIEAEPTLLWGAMDRLMLELHAHVARPSGGSFDLEAVAPAVTWRLTPLANPWGLALSAEYEFSQSHEEADRVEARLALSRELATARWAFDLVTEEAQEDEADVEWGYAAGFRHRLRQGLDWGLEAAGGFESEAEDEALLGLYFDPAERWTVQLGAGTAISDEGPDLTLRTAVVWRAR